mmetsp:Transcript_12146/g.30752  ORF Transcript_12146/g.30752 Transcript_12146/m.30752 type:complete len:229 (-) Transcript_12146:119-805(-)|eukprot:CAMPEP_0177649622 /NCGR_PEP_ID=MMETSP0447-20121125/11492_1 /TAXON_ID=0 /ORGANISM="Stygamoeba regulata, Strain BSH-02190019" /LENGTH=228 /DNA_ID=CAMNT_0019152407 /DNA_START=310 /DNA_END=996 /DNA_ORIENTATION=+
MSSSEIKKKKKEDEKKKKEEEKKKGKAEEEDDEEWSDDSDEEESKSSKGGLGQRFKKNVAGKVMTSALGKKIIPPQLRGLLKGLNRIIARVHDKKKASEIERSMIKIIVKAKLAMDAKKVNEEEFMKADTPLRKSFDMIVDLYDYYGDDVNDRMLKKMDVAVENMREVGNIIATLMKPHIQPKTQNRLKAVFDTLCKRDFLKAVWENPNTGKDLEDLIDAMHKYTQFH